MSLESIGTRETVLPSAHKITLDGREYTLRYRAWAHITYMEQTGGDLLREFYEVGQAMRDGTGNTGRFIKYVCNALWVGMLETHPEVKREDVPHMFEFAELESILQTLSVALTATLPKPRPTEPIVETGPHHNTDGMNGNGSISASELNVTSVSENFSDIPYAISPI